MKLDGLCLMSLIYKTPICLEVTYVEGQIDFNVVL